MLGTEVHVRGEITHKSDAGHTVTIHLVAEDQSSKKIFASGDAMVQLLK
jgi:hypothetical protein